MTSSNGNIFRVTGPLCGEFTGPGEFPTQRPVTRSFDVFFDRRLNKRLSKQPRGWWLETLSCSLWRQSNDIGRSYTWMGMHNTLKITRISYTLGREYRVMRNRYSRLLFTSEDRLCANLRVQEQSRNMTSQCQYLAFAWRHRSTVVTSQCEVRKGRPWRQLRNERSMMVFTKNVCSRTSNSV